MALNIIKYFGVALTKLVKDLDSENFKILNKETEKDVKISIAHELAPLI